jgi:hypothetical protein
VAHDEVGALCAAAAPPHRAKINAGAQIREHLDHQLARRLWHMSKLGVIDAIWVLALIPAQASLRAKDFQAEFTIWSTRGDCRYEPREYDTQQHCCNKFLEPPARPCFHPGEAGAI